jgi:ABC-type Fe3+/spermidine/putrescine transport system ATPase subunit
MADRIVVMNQGVIEQVGTPTEVYRTPKSAFVADFVGTTNFLPGVVIDRGHVRFSGIDLACELDIKPGAGHDVTLAIRPEDVVVRNISASTPNSFPARIAEIEFLGSFCRRRARAQRRRPRARRRLLDQHRARSRDRRRQGDAGRAAAGAPARLPPRAEDAVSGGTAREASRSRR